MENASKALIIAGAILLSILIIGLGMYIYTTAAGVFDGVNFDQDKANAYNAEFLQYAGKQSGTNAKALFRKISSHNVQNSEDQTLQIELTIDGNAYEEGAIKEATDTEKKMPANTLKNGLTYDVTFAYDKSSGYITACNISQRKSGNGN